MSSSRKLFVPVSLVVVSVLLLTAPTARADWMTPGAIYDSSPSADGMVTGLMIDNNLGTYSKQPDDSGTAAPTTGYVILDLGSKLEIGGFKFWARDHVANINPSNVDFFYWNNEAVNKHTFSPNTSDQIASDTNVVFAVNRDLPPRSL